MKREGVDLWGKLPTSGASKNKNSPLARGGTSHGGLCAGNPVVDEALAPDQSREVA